MFGSLGAPELLIIGAIIILIFGVGKLSGLGKDLGNSIKEFRKAVKDEDDAKAAVTPPQYSTPQVPTAPTPPPAQPGQSDKPNVF